ncbi:MAG TPA: hypothetical protein VFK14_00055 [Solirubrobacterales bacterium]|nr:hypothetical protein [Solirubrobacterales bacterium]
MTRPIVKPVVDVAGVTAHRRILGELPAREAAELPVRRRTPRAQAAYDSFREMLEPREVR